MRESFFERFGSWLAFGLVTLFAWRLISFDLHELEAFSLFFPLKWVALTPAGPFVEEFLAPFRAAPWWLWAEVAITVFTWMFLYYLARTIFYRTFFMEGISMWIAFAICILLATVFVIIIFKPAFDQMEIWRSAWPGGGRPSL